MNFNMGLEEVSNMNLINNATKSITMSEAGIDNLAVETMQVSKVVNDYLNRIVDIMESTKIFYQCENGDLLRRKFDELKINFPIVVQNIENYAYSLKKAKANFLNRTEVEICRLKNATLNVRELIKKEVD